MKNNQITYQGINETATSYKTTFCWNGSEFQIDQPFFFSSDVDMENEYNKAAQKISTQNDAVALALSMGLAQKCYNFSIK